MAVTLFASDLHGDFDLAKAIGTATHKFDAQVVFGGDYLNDDEVLKARFQMKQLSESDQFKKMSEEQRKQVDDSVQELNNQASQQFGSQFQTLDEIVGTYKNKAYGVLGNHDDENIARAVFKNLQLIEGKKQKINGQIYYGVDHYSARAYDLEAQQKRDNHFRVESQIEKLKKEKGIDVLVMHEGAHEKLAHKGEAHHKGLAKFVKERKLGIFCGHEHDRSMYLNDDQELMMATERVYAKIHYSTRYAVYSMDVKTFKEKYSEKAEQKAA